MIPNITQGDRMSGLMVYLAGPGRANEHEEPHLVAGDASLMAWHDDNELNRDAALDIANSLDRAKQFYGTDVDGGHVFHCSLSLAAEEGKLTDQQWGDIANDYMDSMGFTGADGKAPCRWVAVRHGVSKNGNDHVHIVASMVRDDGTKWNDWKSKYKSQQVSRELEKKYGLNQLGEIRAERGFTPAEQEKARRQGKPEVERHSVARTVRACAAASSDEAEFVRRTRQEGLLVRPRFAAGRSDVVTGYSVAERPVRGERAIWYGGNAMGRDLTLPKLRMSWTSTPENATEAVSEWTAAGRNKRVVTPGRETITPSAELWQKHAEEVGELRAKLAATPYTDHAAWAQAARETSAAFGAWSKRIEPTPGPLADAARELSKSAQLRHYPQVGEPRTGQSPKAGIVSARGATMILLASTSKSDRAAYALMFRQLALTAKAIHDMHAATNDLQRVRRLTTAMAGITQAVEASALANTVRTSTPDEKVSEHAVRTPVKVQEATLEELRVQHPGADEETLRAFQIAGRGRSGSPVPTPLTKGEGRAALAGSMPPARAPQHTTNEPDLER
ncbi:relaxase/mobilization nuclease domain-containing protein [Arthrobacter bussei]|uniref:Relaxase n=1 Tax=Arthrobacter bussei TaxID=2594179 RepID=A0A7X1TPX4_9MICC|nr:relaxase [Arthrobacter bussei]